MAISASSIASSSTLNELRTQFNNLVTDVTAIEGGAISYTTLNTTTTNATTLNVKEDGTIVFEGATDDGFETTLTVVDPTADRTITFPNETGTVHTTGGDTTHTNIIVADGGNIGSASDTNAIGISSGGVVSVTATTANTSASDGALTVAGGLGVAADVSIGDDLRLISDSAVLSFGADSDTTLTHTDGSGLTLNSTNKLMFNDASQFIQGASATVLDIAATDEIELTATLIDIVGRAEVSGNLSVGGNLDVTGTLDLSDSNFTNVGSIQLDSIAGDGDTDSSITFSGSDVITIATGGSTAATFNASQVTTLSGNLIIPDAGNIGSASDTDAIAIGSDGDITLTQDLELQHDGAILSFGANDEIALTHVHDTGLLLTDSGGSPTLQLHDSAESVSSDGSKLILTSNSVAFNFPNADGTAGQVIKTDGSGTLSFVTASANTPTSADGQALGSASLEWSDLFLADSGTIQFGNDQDVILTHVPDVGLKLSHEATGDNLPIVLNLESEEDAIISGEEIGRIDFTAGDSGGTDAILTAASIAAVAEDTFAADNNSTGLAFKLGVSAAATEMFRMDHDGDFKVLTDGSAIAFGANNEIELTHVHDTGLLLTDSGGTPTLQFHDANESIASDGSKLIIKSGGTTFNLPTSDGSANQVLETDGSGTLSFVTASANTPSSADGQALGSASLEWSDLFLADSSTIQFGNDQDVILTHVPDVGLKLSHEATGDNLPIVLNLESEEDAIISGEEIGRIDFTAGDSDGTDAVTTAASIAAVAEDTFAADNNSTGLAFKLGVSAAATEMFRMDHDGDFKVLTDGSAIAFGANNEIELTHVHDTGLLLTDSGGSPTLQFHDANESVMSDGTNLKLTSGGTAYTIPTSDGSNGQFLKTNGSGVLSFGTVTTTGAFVVYEYTATAGQTSFSGNDDNSSSLSYTAGVNNVLVSVNGVLLDGSDYTATNGTAVVLSVAAAANDMIKIQATNSSSITSTDLNGSELVLDTDGDTTIAADTDDTIDIKISGADDFRFTANTLTALSGSSIVVPDGGLTFGSTAISSTAAELNKLDGATVTTAEINIIDGGTSATSTTVADADRVVLNDDGTMVQVAMTDIKTYIGGGTSWQAVKTGDFTAAAGQGVFCDTSSAAFTLTLPASPSIGDEVAFKDYAKTFDTNNLTIARNSSKIEGATNDLTVDVEGAGNTLVFTDSTQGWLLRNK